MIQLNLDIPRRETRSATPGDAVIESILSGGGYASPSVPAVLSACVSRLSGVLASADIDVALVGILPAIARQIIWTGEIVLFLNPDLRLEIVTSYDMAGSAENRVYTIDINGPSRSLTYKNVGQDQICHSIIRPSPMAPWRGEGWKQSAGIVAVQLERQWIKPSIEQEGRQPRGSASACNVASESPRDDWRS